MEYTLLKNIAVITMGQSPSSSSYNEEGVGIPFYQGNADFGELYPTARIWCNEPKKIANKNDILISVRAPIGALNYATEQCCIGRGLASITVKDEVLRNYVFRLLKANRNKLINQGSGSTFKAIGKSNLEELRIPIVDEMTQKKIMNLMDATEQIIRQRQIELQLFDDLIKARFVELFGNSEQNPRGLPVLPWNKVFLTTTGKLDSNAMVENGQYPFFTCAKESFWIDTYAFDCEALLLAGNNAAGVYDVKHYKGKFNAYQRTYVLRLVNEQWSYRVFKRQLEDKLRYLKSQSKGTNTRYLTLGILNKLRFVVPPVTEQEQFSMFVAQVDKSKAAVQKALDETQLLFDSLMQEYFG